MTYHQPTIDECVSIIGLDESTGLISRILALPVAAWTRERPTTWGYYYVRSLVYLDQPWWVERLDNDEDVNAILMHGEAEFCPLLPPPPPSGEEGG